MEPNEGYKIWMDSEYSIYLEPPFMIQNRQKMKDIFDNFERINKAIEGGDDYIPGESFELFKAIQETKRNREYKQPSFLERLKQVFNGK